MKHIDDAPAKDPTAKFTIPSGTLGHLIGIEDIAGVKAVDTSVNLLSPILIFSINASK